MNREKRLTILLLTEKLQKLTNAQVTLVESDTLKNYEITFSNPEFHISNNTITSFVDKLKRQDKHLIFNPKESGIIKNGKIIRIKSSLPILEVKSSIKEFTNKYEHLLIVAVVKG